MLKIWGLQLHSGFTFTYPNSIGTLWAYLSTKKDIFEHIELTGIGCRAEDSVVDLLPEVDENGVPDVILVTLYIWNTVRSNKLTKLIKEKFPNVTIIAGGAEIPENKERFKEFVKNNPQYDYLVWKEGEIPLEMILRRILSEKNIYVSDYYDDCYNYCKDGEIITGTKKFRYLDHKNYLDIPSPFSMGLFDEIYEKYKDINLQAVLETNRGCPYSCTFCDWGLREKLRKFNIQRIQEEIDWMTERADEVFIADANFGILDRDLEIAKYFVKSKIKHKNPRTHSLVFSHAKNNKEKVLKIAEILEKFDLSRSGATFALQSMNPDTLKAIKRENMNISTDFDWITKQFLARGVPYTNELILGLPLETKETFFKSLDMLLEYNPLSMNTFKLQLLENSEINYDNHSEKYGMKWSKFRQTDSKYEDEREIAYLIEETNTMPREDFKFTRLIRDFIEILWMGKIVYFIGRYLQKEKVVTTTKFMIDINDWFKSNDNEFWQTFRASKEDIRDGVEVPLWYDTDKFKFHRFVNAFIFLAGIPDNRERFYNGIKQMCFEYYPSIDKEIIKDLVYFNDNFVVDKEMSIRKSFSTEFNWVNYFMTGKLEKEYCNHELKIYNVGNKKKSLDHSPDELLYYMAGGHNFLFNKQNCFIYHAGSYYSQTSKLNFINKYGLFYDEEEFNNSALELIKSLQDEFSEMGVEEKELFNKFLHRQN